MSEVSRPNGPARADGRVAQRLEHGSERVAHQLDGGVEQDDDAPRLARSARLRPAAAPGSWSIQSSRTAPSAGMASVGRGAAWAWGEPLASTTTPPARGRCGGAGRSRRSARRLPGPRRAGRRMLTLSCARGWLVAAVGASRAARRRRARNGSAARRGAGWPRSRPSRRSKSRARAAFCDVARRACRGRAPATTPAPGSAAAPDRRLASSPELARSASAAVGATSGSSEFRNRPARPAGRCASAGGAGRSAPRAGW